MTDARQEIKKTIDLLDINQKEKDILFDRLEKEGPSEALMLDIKKYLNQIEEKLLPELTDLNKAQVELDSEMMAIEKDAKNLDTEMSKNLDDLDLQSTRKDLEK